MHLCEWACLLSWICMWAAAKQHLAWLLMASCEWCERKGCFWGHLCQFCCDLCCGAQQRSCRWAALQSPQCVTATEDLKLSFRRLGSKSGSSSWDCTEVSSKTLGFWLEREHWEWRILTKAFQGLFSTALLPGGSTPCFCCKPRDWSDFLYIAPSLLLLPIVLYNSYTVLGDFCQFMQVFKSLFRIPREDFTHGLSLQT